MVKFTLFGDIQEGFKDDTIIIKVNGKEVFKQENITTKLLRGPAASFSTDIKEGSVKLEAIAPKKNLQGSHEFEVNSDIYIGISIVESDGRQNMRFITNDHPFGYL